MVLYRIGQILCYVGEILCMIGMIFYKLEKVFYKAMIMGTLALIVIGSAFADETKFCIR